MKLEEKSNVIESDAKEDADIRVEFKDANFTWGFRLQDNTNQTSKVNFREAT
jgi:hypothetical protein